MATTYFYSDFSRGWYHENPVSGFVSRCPQIATLLADEFDQCLRWHMGADDYAEAVRRNHADSNRNVCHTHDFIDANEMMETAFQTLIGRPSEADSDTDASLWNGAWAQWRMR